MNQTNFSHKLDGFEGPEKNLQVIFIDSSKSTISSEMSLRSISQERWQQMLNLTACTIMSCMKSKYCTSYVLSESSLFVFDDRVILKTCGTTRLLCGLDDILGLGESLGLTPAAVLFWRKSFSYPEKQLPPHTSFEAECAYLDARCVFDKPKTVRSFYHDSQTHDNWSFYMANLLGKELAFKITFPSTFELKMHEIHPDAAKHFFEENRSTSEAKAAVDRVRSFVPEMLVDELNFEPCGYSMNGLSASASEYSTVHITPEAHCSYVSFETTSTTLSTSEMANKVLGLFHPASFTATIIGGNGVTADCFNDIAKYNCFVKSSFMLCDVIPITVWGFEINSEEHHPLQYYTSIRQSEVVSKPDSKSNPTFVPDDSISILNVTDEIETDILQWHCFKTSYT